jgi:hypothetical protein
MKKITPLVRYTGDPDFWWVQLQDPGKIEDIEKKTPKIY